MAAPDFNIMAAVLDLRVGFPIAPQAFEICTSRLTTARPITARCATARLTTVHRIIDRGTAARRREFTSVESRRIQDTEDIPMDTVG